MDVYELCAFITNKYEDLCAEYNVPDNKCSLILGDWLDFINSQFEYRYKDIDKEDLLQIINDDALLFNDSFMHSLYDVIDNELVFRIVIPVDHLNSAIVNFYKNDFVSKDDIYNFIEITMRHEFGHILYISEVFAEKGIEAGSKYINNINSKQITGYFQYMDYLTKTADQMADDYDAGLIDHDMSEYEFHHKLATKYYSYKCESEANKHANVNTKQLIALDLKVRLGLTKSN